MSILFLDLSTKSTGWCLSSDQGEMLSWGCITASGTNTVKRIYKIQQKIGEIIESNKVTKLVMEDVHPDEYGEKSHTERVLMWLQGCIILEAYTKDNKFDYKNVEFMHSSEWRKQIGIKTGRGIKREKLKQEDINFVKEKYNIEENDDVCDAICLYTAYFTEKKEEVYWI